MSVKPSGRVRLPHTRSMRTGSLGTLPSSITTLPLIRIARGASPGKFPGEFGLPVGMELPPPTLPGVPVGIGTPPGAPRPCADNCITVKIIPANAAKSRGKFMIRAPRCPDYTLRKLQAHEPYTELTVLTRTRHSGGV